ncbi:ChaN family lipoprotein [Pseudomonas lalucatii]|uniref:ChaN family lipoprotein n=1 Tax=Pseudomonas lalucatii TaxID=1424203 RepID=A0ABS5PZQ2_9PSED|nr:ChaN family lipoprotein [Pseudomonas lalucatii]MBS7661967.1 ChaN family lipoprotein [Pseudomonas lalucatii]MBS7726180.1 ChaN family lipoprotein [Pseudomonas lalucatii]QVM88249.1 ChaN family lipoprotein [Pseudomonas lalucatii]
MRLLLPFLLMLLSACQALPPLPAWQGLEGRSHADLGVIRDLRSGERLAPEALVERLADAERLLVGERHDNPDHHALQLWLLRALATRREQGALLLEMLEPTQQARVDAARTAARLPADLPAALAWQPGWDWTLYGPILRHALAQPYPLRAANLARDELLAIYRRPPALPAGAASAPAVRERLLAQLREAHCGKLPDSQLPAMLAVQQQRDRRMAEALLAAPAPSLLLAGAYHVRRDLGVPLHLADLGAGAATRVLLLAEVGSAVAADQADFVWYTPAVPEQDHCAAIDG